MLKISFDSKGYGVNNPTCYVLIDVVFLNLTNVTSPVENTT